MSEAPRTSLSDEAITTEEWERTPVLPYRPWSKATPEEMVDRFRECLKPPCDTPAPAAQTEPASSE